MIVAEVILGGLAVVIINSATSHGKVYLACGLTDQVNLQP